MNPRSYTYRSYRTQAVAAQSRPEHPGAVLFHQVKARIVARAKAGQ